MTDLTKLAVALAVTILVGCGDDTPTAPAPNADTHATDAVVLDAGAPDVGPVADAKDPADAPVAPDTGPPVPESGPRAFVITPDRPEELEHGPMTGARLGDVVIMNERVRFVIRTGDASVWLAGIGGGGVIDVGSPAEDRVQEIVPVGGFTSFGPDAEVVITQNGAGGLAEIKVTATATTPSLIGEHVPGLGIEGRIIQYYRLRTGERALEMTVELPDVTTEQLTGDIFFLGGELKTIFRESDGWLATESETLNIGYVAGEPVEVLELGGITAVLGPTMAPPVSWTRWLVVGDGSLSSVIDGILELRMAPQGHISGTVDDPAAMVGAYDEDNELVSRFRPDATGAFAGNLPVGFYRLQAEGPGRAPGAPLTADVIDGGTVENLELSAADPAVLEVTLLEPTRLTIQNATSERIVPLPPGKTAVPLAPGDYVVTATRGFEYEHQVANLTLEAGQTASFAPVLERTVDTTGWVASDFHLHSEWSPDSNVPLATRVLACAAEGIEYAVATDHDMVTDYAPFVPEAVKPYIRVGIGVEVSTAKFGHLNVFPMIPDPSLPGHGAPLWHGLEFPELVNLLAGDGTRVVQINHGRGEQSAALDRIGYDPTDPTDTTLDGLPFNAMEVLNGGGHAFDELVLDWLTLVQGGKTLAATGVSDSHVLGALCGNSRTMVRVVGDDDLATLDTDAANNAVRAGLTMATSGPFITVEAKSPGVVHVRVQAPSWMPVDQVQLYADGQPDLLLTLLAPTGPVRFDEDVTLNNADATWATGVASSVTQVPPMVKNRLRALAPASFFK